MPVVVGQPNDKAEIDLILRQLFLLKQDTEFIQKVLMSGSIPSSSEANSFQILEQGSIGISIPDNSMEISEDGHRLIRDDAIGDMNLSDLEREAITRSLRYFNNNRRKTAKSLGMSERTLYRKIEEYGLEPKIKRRK